jgi:CRP-like cAMP-binding protein
MTQSIDCSFLMNSLLGQDLDPDDCSVLAGIMSARELQDGEDLVKMGDTSRTLFVLASGSMTVNCGTLGNDGVMYTIKVGECAGTRAFVEGTPRPANLRSVGKSTVLTLEPEDFESLLESHPQVLYKFMRGLFRQTHSNLVKMDVESQQLSNYINKMGGRY